MRHRLLLCALLLSASAAGQTLLQVPSTPVKPGVSFQVVLTNRTTICIDPLRTNVLTLLGPEGDLIAPLLVGCGPLSLCLRNGAARTLTYSTPATGPGSLGSYVLYCPYGSLAAARLDVVVPSPRFPDLHAFPTALPHGPGGHRVSGPPAPGGEWTLTNTAAQARTVSPLFKIFAPGATSPLTSMRLSNVTVPAGGAQVVSLPLAGLAAGPYSVEVSWNDPGLQGPITVRHGIVLTTGTVVDLHFPFGKSVPRGGSLPIQLVVNQAYPRAAPAWTYAVALGYAPGTIPLPGGVKVPLALDELVIASLQSGLFGYLVKNTGQTTSQGVYCAHRMTYYPVATGIAVRHPGPAVAGLTLRIGAVAIAPGGSAFAASQPEEIVFP